jgi:hypothetical protein
MNSPTDVLALFSGPREHSATVLTVDLANEVDYQADISDPALFATKTGITPAATPKNFFVVTLIADIVAVNGIAMKGTYVGRTRPIVSSPNPPPGDAIADVTRTAMREHFFEILNTDGTSVGTIMSTGFSGGTAPPGLGPPANQKGNWVIVGGTGFYLGARGQVGGTGGSGRAASMAEDPGKRRVNGGLSNRFILHVVPMGIPEIVRTAAGHTLFHSDSTPVTELRPAQAGQALYLFARGLGPTHPDVDLTQPFPATPPSVVNAPITVTAAGKAALNVSAAGVPGAVDGYRVDFKMPAGAGAGALPVLLTAGWIAGRPVTIAAA